MKIYSIIILFIIQNSFSQSKESKIDSIAFETTIETIAFFPEGPEAFKKYVERNIRLPEMKDKVSGEIRMKFTVGIDGNITDVKLVKNTLDSLGVEISIDVIRVLKFCPKWIPATRNGKPIAMISYFPLKISNL